MDTIFIPSKGRYTNCATHKNFEAFDIHNWAYIVEPPEKDLYIKKLASDGVYKPETHVYAFDVNVFKAPKSKENPLGFDYLDDHGWHPGDKLTTGPGPARNALHHLAKQMGLKNYWMMDDDIQTFAVDSFFFQKNSWTKPSKKKPIGLRLDLKNTFELYERFLDKYENVGLAEFEKQGLTQNHRKNTHFSINCKSYSCIRFKTDGPDIPWRSRYNDDVMISLDYEKRGFVNVSCKMLAYATPDTQKQAGGMTEAFHQEGTLRKVKYLVKAYPECSFFSLRFGRFHHLVDYSKFDQLPVLSSTGDTLDDITDFNPFNRTSATHHWQNIDDVLREQVSLEQQELPEF
jgi:hypothetical protein